jgi:hypothetical protein
MLRPSIVGSDRSTVLSCGNHSGKTFLDGFTEAGVAMTEYISNEINAPGINREYLVVGFDFQLKIY